MKFKLVEQDNEVVELPIYIDDKTNKAYYYDPSQGGLVPYEPQNLDAFDSGDGAGGSGDKDFQLDNSELPPELRDTINLYGNKSNQQSEDSSKNTSNVNDQRTGDDNSDSNDTKSISSSNNKDSSDNSTSNNNSSSDIKETDSDSKETDTEKDASKTDTEEEGNTTSNKSSDEASKNTHDSNTPEIDNTSDTDFEIVYGQYIDKHTFNDEDGFPILED